MTISVRYDDEYVIYPSYKDWIDDLINKRSIKENPLLKFPDLVSEWADTYFDGWQFEYNNEVHSNFEPMNLVSLIVELTPKQFLEEARRNGADIPVAIDAKEWLSDSENYYYALDYLMDSVDATDVIGVDRDRNVYMLNY